MPSVIILADDLTGACDSAAAFLGRVDTVRVLLRSSPVQVTPGKVLAFSTETRNVSSSDAARIVENATAEMSRVAECILFKKVDSAGRGHLATETMAALRASKAALALVAPAFPSAGRTVRNGVLSIQDSAQSQTRKDVPAMFPAHCRDAVDLLPTADEDELEQAIRRALDHGTRVLLCDAETQQDLVRLATAARRINQPILWTGSAGLASALASRFAPIRPRSLDRAWPDGRTLLFVGTDHPVTELQVSTIMNTPESHVHRIDWNGSPAERVRITFAEAPVSAMVLTGGDTAAFVLATLNAEAIRLVDELAPGIPWGHIEGGAADGCVVVTKSGGFGQQDALAMALNFCSRRVCEPA